MCGGTPFAIRSVSVFLAPNVLMEEEMSSALEDRQPLGEKLALLAHMRKISQGKLAERCKISRISVNRFFKGKSEIRAGDFVALLAELGIDLHAALDEKLQSHLNGEKDENGDPIYRDVAHVLEQLDVPVRKTLLEQVLWWGKSSSLTPSNSAISRIQGYINS